MIYEPTSGIRAGFLIHSKFRSCRIFQKLENHEEKKKRSNLIQSSIYEEHFKIIEDGYETQK